MERMPKWADVVLIPLISLLLAALISGLVILAIGEDPINALNLMVKGALGSTYGWGYTLYYATNFLFTGLAVAVAFHARLFNIGGEGQAMLGGLGVALGCLYLPWPHWSLALIGAFVASAYDDTDRAMLYGLLRQHLARPGRPWLPVWEGILRGGSASLVAALGLYCFTATYVFVIHPDWPDLVLVRTVEQMRAQGVPEAEIREHARAFRWGFTPSGLAVSVIGIYSIVGVMASSVLTLWLNWRRKEPTQLG